MSNLRFDRPSSAYLYPQHPFVIHPGDDQTKGTASLHPHYPVVVVQHDPGDCYPPGLPWVTNTRRPYSLLPQPKWHRIVEAPYLHPPAFLPGEGPSPPSQNPAIDRRTAIGTGKKSSTKASPPREHPDGNTLGAQSVPSTQVTSRREAMAGGRKGGDTTLPRPSRTSIVSPFSNSVPSTPLQQARRSRSRSPSPGGALGNHSPRSVSSEANGILPGLRVHRCKYETNAAFGKRRIPYVSSDILETPMEEPKVTLDPLGDKKLSDDMRVLYNRLQPSAENAHRRDQLVKKLQRILETEFPGNHFTVHVFGSSGNMLFTSESDVDICIQTPMKKLEEMHGLAEALAKHGMENVVCIPQAKVRIVKVWDPVLKLACDLNVNNTLALQNTRMIKTCVEIDERVRPLAMIIKYWTKQRVLNDAALGGTISSYTWICMILNFLQTRNPPILPSLQGTSFKAEEAMQSGHNTSEDNLSKLVGFGQSNTESLGHLLFHFFRRYGYEVDFEASVISVRHGRLLTRREKNWHVEGLQKEGRNRLCVEEPFNTERNLGNSADDFAWRGIHLEIRRAFDALATGQPLDTACEQFEFPVEEKTTPLFQKPQPTKTTLMPSGTSTASSKNRNANGNRGANKNGGYQKGNSGNGRRASSGASNGANRSSGTSAPEYYPRGLNDPLHDQLYQQYQLLEMRRAQLVAQQRAQQATLSQAAHAHAHTAVHMPARNGRPHNPSGSPQKSLYIDGHAGPVPPNVGFPPNALPPGFLFHYPGFIEPMQSHLATSQAGSRTNPSSPLLASSVPSLRRQVHRAPNNRDANEIRSHSQPPQNGMALGAHVVYPIGPYYDTTTFAGYPIVRSTQEISSPPSADAHSSPSSSSYPESVTTQEHGTPKDSVGPPVEQLPPPRRSLRDYRVGDIPSFDDLARRKRHVSQEFAKPLPNGVQRQASPSPLGIHARSYSTAVGGTAGPAVEQSVHRSDVPRPANSHGPVIANGSYPLAMHEPRMRNTLETSGAWNPIPSALGISNNYDVSDMLYPRQQDPTTQRSHQQPTEESVLKSMSNGRSRPALLTVDVRERNHASDDKPPPASAFPDVWGHVQSSGLYGDMPVAYENGHATPQKSLPRQVLPEAHIGSQPLLSPVFETRTPSPTTSRNAKKDKVVNGTNHQVQLAESSQPGRPISLSPPSPKAKEKRSSPTNGHQESPVKISKPANGGNLNHGSSNQPWQQTSKKKKKGKSQAHKQNDKLGYVIPANAAERKGG